MRQTKYIALAIIILTLKLNARNFSLSWSCNTDNINADVIKGKHEINFRSFGDNHRHAKTLLWLNWGEKSKNASFRIT